MSSKYIYHPLSWDDAARKSYRETLRKARYDLQQTEHTVDSQRQPSRQTDALFASVPCEDTLIQFDDEHLPTLPPLPGGLDLESEDFTPTEATIKLIHSIHNVPSDDELSSLFRDFISPPSRRIPKLELPLLTTDPEIDLRDYLKEVPSNARPSPLYTSILPLEPVNIEEDGGMEPPASYQEIQKCLNDQLDNEEPDFTKNEVLQNDEDWGDLQKYFIDDICHLRGRPRSLTPPLMSSDDAEPTDPLKLGFDFPISSDPFDLEEDPNYTLDAIMKDDEPRDSGRAMTLPSTPPDMDTIAYNSKRVKASDLVLETPIMSDDVAETPNKDIKNSFFDDAIIQAFAADTDTRADHGQYEEPNGDKILAEMLKTSEQQALQAIGQEEPNVVDAVIRLPIPSIDFELPEPEWKTHASSPEDMFLHLLSTYKCQFQISRYPRNPPEDRKLRWMPFPTGMAKVNLDEEIGDLGSVMDKLTISRDCPLPNMAGLLPDKDGLAMMLKDKDEDPLTESEGGDVDVIEEVHSSPKQHSGPPSELSIAELARKRKLERTGTSKRRRQDHLFASMDESNAAPNLLDNYIRLQDPKRTKLRSSEYFPPPPKTGVPVKLALKPPPKSVEKKKALKAAEPTSATAFQPNVPAPSTPIRLIVSTAVPYRLLSGLLEHFSSGLDFIDRDFSRHNKWMLDARSMERKQFISPLAFEADIVLSPSTGIIITSLGDIQPRSPGGAASLEEASGIRERVAKVASLYERMFIMVFEEGQDNSTSDLSTANAEALSSFSLFTLTLQRTDVKVLYVGGGFQALTAWTSWLISSHLADEEVQGVLYGEETDWEIFLRSAGMNIYAAQVVISSLKGRYGDDGMRMFLRMSTRERIGSFQEVLGGRDMLVRVSERLSRSWA